MLQRCLASSSEIILPNGKWLVLLLLIVSLILFILSQIPLFLAVSAPIKADALVVEGWMRDDAVKEAIVEFKQGGYKILIATGGPIAKGYYLSQYKSFAELTAATLVTLGFDRSKLIAISAPKVKRNRTVATAVALREWLLTSELPLSSINIYSFDVHTRRSWLIFKKVLPEFRVGAIAYPSPEYDFQTWWMMSQGVRSVMSETIAYLYVRLINWKS